MRPEAYKSPAFIALVTVLCVALVLLLHHCVLVACRRNGGDQRRRRQHHHRHHNQQQQQETEEEVSISVEISAVTSRTHLVQAAAVSPAVVSAVYRKEEEWKEPTCAVCLADFDDGEAVRVLPECLHYFHAECIGTWLQQGSTSCPMCRAETTPTPSPASLHHHHHHRHLDLSVSVSVSLEEILVRT